MPEPKPIAIYAKKGKWTKLKLGGHVPHGAKQLTVVCFML